jgi:hypothetical protein
MKPLEVKPVRADYRPGYPRFVEVEDWESLIRASNGRLFRPETLLFAGILGTSLFLAVSGCAPAPVQEARADGPDEPAPGPPLKSPNAKVAEIANRALGEVRKTGFWYPRSKVEQAAVVKGNPSVTIPKIPISFGNSHLGVFDTTRAKKITLELFAAYGLKLEGSHRFQKGEVVFEADGYDPKAKIGFEILKSDRAPGALESPPPKPETDPAKLLDDKETAALKQAVAGGQETFFLAPVEAYPNMDGDQYTPLRAYLQSVLDYLEWLKQQGRL